MQKENKNMEKHPKGQSEQQKNRTFKDNGLSADLKVHCGD